MDHCDVDAIVIGGGFAGLIAARDLVENGHSVLLLEARDRLGGRAHFAKFPGTEKSVELGGTWVMPRYMEHVAREIDRYGWHLTGSEAGNLQFHWQCGKEDPRAFPLEPDDRYAFERALFEIGRDARRIDPNLPRDQQDLADLDVTVDEYLQRMDLPQSVYDLIAAFARIGAGAAVQEWSALMALSLIAAFENSPLAWFASVTTRFRDGTADATRSLSETSTQIRLGAVVTHVTQSSDGVRVRLAQGDEFSARAAVVAVPVPVWSDIVFSPPLGTGKQHAADHGHAGNMRKVWILVENMDDSISSFGPHTDFLLLQTEYRVGERSILVGFVSPPADLDVADPQAIVRAVHQHAPHARVIETLTHDWRKDPWAKGSWMVNPPGQLSRFGSSLSSPEGRLFFAGADIATKWIGWIDGAIETGATAASNAMALIQP